MTPVHTSNSKPHDGATSQPKHASSLPTAGLNRRRFLTLSATSTVGAAAAHMVAGDSVLAATSAQPTTAADASGTAQFLHSVASGDPRPTAVVIWTRVTPSTEAVPGSGIGADTPLTWQVATDIAFENIVAAGTATVTADTDHTVKIDVQGLQPATTYFYRFSATGIFSRIGRTRTAPAEAVDPGRVRFAVCSCSNYEAGWFQAYREIAERDDIEFMLHLGDFTYEYASGVYGGAYGTIVRNVQPPHRTMTLRDYRIRQGHYHLDEDLADVLAAKPLIALWDDHEFADNAWRSGATGDSPVAPEDYAQLRAAATQAYLEWMPVRAGAIPSTGGTAYPDTNYRTLRYGSLMELIVPDLRSYRDQQVLLREAEDGTAASDDYVRDVAASDRSMMGSEQFDWFAQTLQQSTSRWQIVANQVMFAPMTLPTTLDLKLQQWLVKQLGIPTDGIALNTDQWDGYMFERQRILDLIGEHNLGGVVFLTGDIHSSWAADIPADAAQYRLGRDTRVRATEFIGPSVSAASAFDAIAVNQLLEPQVREALRVGETILQEVDHWYKYIDLSQHGYMVVDIDAQRTQADWHHGPVLQPEQPLTFTTSFQAIFGQPGASLVGEQLPQTQRVY